MDSEATAADDDSARGVTRPIGEILGAARLSRGLELSEIARDTRVPLRHLAAIEGDNHDSLPALPYAIGFVKAFARVVGVDPDMAATHFRAETSKAAHVPVAPTMTPIDERRLPPRGLVTLSIAALVAVIALVVAWSAGAFDPAPPAAPMVSTAPVQPGAGAPASAPAVLAPTVPVPVPTAGPAAGTPVAALAAAPVAGGPAAVAGAPAASGNIVITANEDVWVKISVFDPAVGKVVSVKTGVLAKGERFVPPARPGLRLWTGRAGALQISVDGRAVPPLGGPVETVKNVSLDAADLRGRIGPTTVPVMASTHKSG